MKTGYFDCFSGAAGDMIVGSLIDAGCPAAYLQSQLDLLGLPPVKLVAESVKRSGIAGCRVHFDFDEPDPPSRHLSTINKMLSESGLDRDICGRVIAVFRRLGDAEARVHDIPIEKIHFHEVGAVDSICDIVGTVVGLKKLGIEKLYASEIMLGSGSVVSAHGQIPLPAPATQEIVKGYPVRRADTGVEMTTPTAAALLVELAEYAPEFEMVVESIGYGAGTRDLPGRPNLLRLTVGSTTAEHESDIVTVIETNIDDSTPEQIAYMQDLLLEEGALDVFVTPILMKKNRPAFLVSVVCRQQQTEKLAHLLLQQSTTAGVRFRSEKRRKLSRRIETVQTSFGPIRIKFLSGGDIRKFSPEYDDVASAAAAARTPFAQVYQAAMQAAAQLEGDET